VFDRLANWQDYLGRLSMARRGLLVFALGLSGALSLAPISIPFFFIAGFALFTVILRTGTGVKAAFFLGWLYALGYHLAGLYWISASLFVDIARYVWVLPFSLLALPSYLALLFAAASALATPLRDRPVTHALALALLIFLSEIVRGYLMTGFPWNLFGYVWTGMPEILQSVSLFGIQGLTLLTLFCAATLGLLLSRPTKGALLALVFFWGSLSMFGLWGHERLEQNPTAYQDDVTIRLVQASIEQKQRRTHEQRIAAFEINRQLSLAPAARPVTHLIWPETASPFFLTSDESARRQLGNIVPRGGALITGTPSKKDGRFYNALVVVDDKGGIEGLYDKSRLVPFGEFIPFRAILKTVPLANDVIGGSADFSAGTGPKTLRASGLPPFSPMICYETIFSGHIVNREDPPDWLLQITNDAWFGDTSGPYQHLAMAQVRAIEEGLPLIRSANSGISAIIDAYGRIVKSIPLDERGVLDGQLPKRTVQKTLFSSH
jgi:apolipoprotein N-acyltransferase